MSRTYRKLPHWMNKKSFEEHFASGFYGHNTRLDNCSTSKQFVKTSTAIYQSCSLRDGLKKNVNPETGKPIGYSDELPLGRENKRMPHKARRSADKAMIEDAITAMVDDAILTMEELEALDAEYEFIDLIHYCDWDEYLYDMEPEPYDDDPYEDYYWDDYFDDWY